MRIVIVLLSVAVANATVGGSLAGEGPGAIIVRANDQSPTGGIQEAIDALGPSGGVVTIPAGVYSLRQAIRVRSNISLQGAGEATVLRKEKQVGSRLAAAADKESRSLRVTSVSGFRAGDEVGIYDEATVGWEHSHAIVKEVRGNELLLDRRVGRSFDPATAAAVINYFPAITGTGVSRVVLQGLTIDGQAGENTGPAAVAARGQRKPPELGFTFAAINLVDVVDSRIEACRVDGWPADGISLQRGSGNRVAKCIVQNCRGEGFHPGGGLCDSEFVEVEGRNNLANGLYFCARVERVIVRNNRFIGNKKNGVGALGDSGDKDNIVEDNICDANGHSGIQLWDGAGNRVMNNTCSNNSQSSPGSFNGISVISTASSVVSGNRCFDNQASKTQKHGIEETANCRDNSITDNDCRSNGQAGVALKGKDSRQSRNLQ
jgi:parallel beta-helix repeat protein